MVAGLEIEQAGVFSLHPAQANVDRVIQANIAALEQRLDTARSVLQRLLTDPSAYLDAADRANALRLWNLIHYTAVGRHQEELLEQLPDGLRQRVIELLRDGTSGS